VKKILLIGLMIAILTIPVIITTIAQENESIINSSSREDFTHTVLVEVATSQNCKPCHYWNQIIYDKYNSGEYDFQYVEMVVFDYNGQLLNDDATSWYSYYDAGSVPKNIMDGDHRRIGNNSETFTQYLNESGNRDVAEITASMTVLWLGDATIQVDIYIINNEATQYTGHIRASISEIVSRYNTYYGQPYHFGFLGFAFDMDITITAGGAYTDSMTWNGNEHQDNHGNDFGDIVPENIHVIMGVLNDDDGYVDETVAACVSDNNPPNEPSNPNPADGEVEVDIDTILSWNCSDPDGDDLTYDIYLGTTSPPPLVESNHNSKSYNPGTLNGETTYYWRIIAWDLPGDFTPGPIWVFSTGPGINNPPDVPTIDGPIEGNPEVSYSYQFTSVDPDGHDIAEYIVNWGDGNDEIITGPFGSGSPATASHTWTAQGGYVISAKAKDVYGAEGAVGTLTVTIPRDKAISSPFLNFLQSHPNMFPLLQKLMQNLGL
jgi:hypothetical protein